VIVAVAAVRMIEVAFNQVIDVIAVQDRFASRSRKAVRYRFFADIHSLLLTQPTLIFGLLIRTLEAALTPNPKNKRRLLVPVLQ